MQKVLVFLFAAQLLCACSNELDQKKAPDNPEVGVRELAQSQVKVKFTPLTEANHYQIELSWPQALGSVRIYENSKVLIETPGSQNQFIKEVDGGAELSFLIEQISTEDKITASLPVTATVPLDLVWDSDINLTEDKTFQNERIFISNNIKITTNGHNLTIDAGLFSVDHGLIQTFPENMPPATWATKGIDGGLITIHAKQATGILKVLLRGQAGGPGKNGQIILFNPSNCKGGPGANGGASGSLSVEIEDGKTLGVLVDRVAGEGGAPGGNSFENDPKKTLVGVCDQSVGEVKAGMPGSLGYICLRQQASETATCH